MNSPPRPRQNSQSFNSSSYESYDQDEEYEIQRVKEQFIMGREII